MERRSFLKRLAGLLGAGTALPTVASHVPGPEGPAGVEGPVGIEGLAGAECPAATKAYVDVVVTGIAFRSSKPTAPIVGDAYRDEAQCVYVYDGTTWLLMSAAATTPYLDSVRCPYCTTVHSRQTNCPTCGAPSDARF